MVPEIDCGRGAFLNVIKSHTRGHTHMDLSSQYREHLIESNSRASCHAGNHLSPPTINKRFYHLAIFILSDANVVLLRTFRLHCSH